MQKLNRCHEIIAEREDRDAQLVQYLGDEILASDATRYIGEFHPAPGLVLAAAFARRSDLVFCGFRRLRLTPIKSASARDADIQDIIRAAARIQKGGGDLSPQMERWRSYLRRFKNTTELVREIDQSLPRQTHADPPRALARERAGLALLPSIFIPILVDRNRSAREPCSLLEMGGEGGPHEAGGSRRA